MRETVNYPPVGVMRVLRETFGMRFVLIPLWLSEINLAVRIELSSDRSFIFIHFTASIWKRDAARTSMPST